MIERHNFLVQDFEKDSSKEVMLLAFIAQSFFQPFSMQDSMLAILTALTSGTGIGFNRAMLFLAENDVLKGELWLGPQSGEEAESMWNILSTPGFGYVEIIEHNRALLNRKENNLTNLVRSLSYPLDQPEDIIPSLASRSGDIIHVRDAWNEPLVEKHFREVISEGEFLCIPLLAQEGILGEMIVDNAITKKAIEPRDIKLASLCGLIAGNTIHTSRLDAKMVEMERLVALGEMAVFITHQLRNPLVTIGGFTDQILSAGLTEEKKKRNLEIIHREVRRLEDIIYKVGHFLKTEVGEPVPFDLREVLERILGTEDVQRKVKKRTLRVEFDASLPPVLCDPVYSEEALRNIIDNALDVTPEGGEVAIRCSRENRAWLVVLIKDSGQGIPSENLGKVFLPFFSTKKNGMGLGLVFAKRVMDSCRGRIEVESEEGRGTVFKLYFQVEKGR